jgi:O-antigen biosynthesis protein
MPHLLNVIDHPVCLAFLDRRAASSWLEHAPFAMWLTSALKPRVLVELGTYYGTSYCAFCQAIEALGLSTRAFAVDTWEGDPHNGSYSHEVLDDLRRHHDPRYGKFSTLLRMTFDEAQVRFADKEIDLIHIDGYHKYEVVRHDFETWLPKLSDRGVILFHDVSERASDFGVWRLWNELTAQYRSFTFVHAHGLGVLAPGPDVPDEVNALVDLRDPDIQRVRTVFHEMGRRLRLATDLEATLIQRNVARQHSEAYRAERDHALQSFRRVDEHLATVQREWDKLLSSQSWRAFHQLHRTALRIGPEGSLLRRTLKRAARLVEAVGREGPIGYARRQVRQAIIGTRPAGRTE